MECALHCQAVLLDGWPECVVECERTKRRTSAESEQKAAGQVDDNADENRSTLERAGNGQVAEKDQAPNGSAAIAPSVDQQEVRPAPAATLPDEGQWVPSESEEWLGTSMHPVDAPEEGGNND